jgi:enoyl-[acyl-carrier protein] reductase II
MTPSIQTRFTAAFGLKHPFACAGLAFAGTTPPLAIAVADAGGVGALGVVGMICAKTEGVINVNFITIFAEDAHIAMCEKIRPPVVSFHWGHPPRAWIDRLQAAGISVWEQVGSVDQARAAVDDGIDVIIAQGAEAGGHNYGSLPLFVQLPAIIDAVAPTMVWAAGGIADGRGIAAALSLGADGAWVWTRMTATREADLAPDYKHRLTEARSEETVLSHLFGRDELDFNPMRVLNNDIVKEYGGREQDAPDDPSTQPILGTMDIMGIEAPLHRFSNLVPMSTATGDVDQMALLAGQGVGLINDLPGAGDVIARMMADAVARLKSLGKAAE